jgi:ribosome-binding protein aMBF1 (putative translation factor)
MITSSKISSNTIDDIEKFEDQLSNNMQDICTSAINDGNLSKSELADRLGINLDELEIIMAKELWPFKTSIRIALAMGVHVSLELLHDS